VTTNPIGPTTSLPHTIKHVQYSSLSTQGRPRLSHHPILLPIVFFRFPFFPYEHATSVPSHRPRIEPGCFQGCPRCCGALYLQYVCPASKPRDGELPIPLGGAHPGRGLTGHGYHLYDPGVMLRARHWSRVRPGIAACSAPARTGVIWACAGRFEYSVACFHYPFVVGVCLILRICSSLSR
jgi:hypothetical protein